MQKALSTISDITVQIIGTVDNQIEEEKEMIRQTNEILRHDNQNSEAVQEQLKYEDEYDR